MSENAKITVTLKAGQGFDSPWIVVHADSLEEANALVEGIAATALDVAAGNAAKELQAKYALASGGIPAQQVSSQAPAAPAPTQAAQAAPAAVTPTAAGGGASPRKGPCEHGVYVWKDFVSKAGRPIKGFFCPATFKTACPADFHN